MDDDRPVDGEPEEELTPDSTPIGQPIPDAEPSTAKNEGPAARSAEAREVFRQKAMGKVEKALGEKLTKSLFGRFVKGAVAGVIGGPIGWAYDLWLILDLIKDPQTRKMGCVSLALFFFILLSIFGIIAVVALAILGAGNEDGQWGITQTQGVSVTETKDMEALRLISCLDENPEQAGRLSAECWKQNQEEVTRALTAAATLRESIDARESSKIKDAALRTLDDLVAALNEITQSGGDVEKIRAARESVLKHRAELRGAMQSLSFSITGCNEHFGKVVVPGPANNSYGFVNPVAGPSKSGPYAGDDGLDIHAERGTPVVAVADATVRYVSNDGSHIAPAWRNPPNDPGAIGLRLSNGTDLFYAHLSGLDTSLQPGATVKQGQVIGCVGVANTVSHLHIGVFPGGYPNYIGPFELEKLWYAK